MPIFGPSYVRWNAYGGIVPAERGEASAFNGLKSAVARHLGHSSMKDLTVSITWRTGAYTDPKTGAQEEVDLLATPELGTAFERYARTIPDSRRVMSDWGVSANSKGDRLGRLSLRKPRSVPAEKLDFENELPEMVTGFKTAKERHAAARRLIFLEQYLSKFNEKLDELIGNKEKELQSPTLPDAQATRLRKELKDLRSLKKKLSGIDFYAIKTVLKHLPIGRANKQVLRQKEDEIRQAVLGDLKKGFFKKIPDATEGDYADDVVGMLYQGRASYFEYAERVFGGHPKQEHISDLFLREALVFGAVAGEEYEAKGFQNSALLEEMGEDLREEMQDVLGGIGRVLSHAAEKKMHEYDYIEQTVPSGTSDDIKKRAQVAKMRASMANHKKKIAAKMGMDPAALPLPVATPGTRSFIRTGLGTGLAVGAAAGAAHYLGVPLPAGVAAALSMTHNHPARSIALWTLADSMRHRIHDLVRPKIRTAGSGAIVRKTNYKRLALVSGTAALIAYLGPMALTAAAPFIAAAEAPGMSPVPPHILMPMAAPMSGLVPPQVPGLLAQVGIVGTVAAQTAGRLVDFVWDSSYVPTGLGSWRIPLIGTWGGNIPTMAAIQLSGAAASRIPVVNRVAELALRPLYYVATSSALAPAGQFLGRNLSHQLGLNPLNNPAMEVASKVAMALFAAQLWWNAFWAISQVSGLSA